MWLRLKLLTPDGACQLPLLQLDELHRRAADVEADDALGSGEQHVALWLS